jgi:peroxiredoxin
MSSNTNRPSRFGWAIVIILFAVAGFLLWVDLNRWKAAVPRSGRAVVGEPAPDVALKGLDGKTVRLSSFSHHPVLLNFFATWCIPCKGELPLLERRYLALRAKGLLIVGIDQEETAAAVRPFARAYGVTFPVVIDDGIGTETYDVHAIPTSIFLDADGVVRAIHVGELSPDGLASDLAKVGI